MTAPTISITDVQLRTAVRSFLLPLIPAGWEVIRSQDNRVPMPAGNFVEILIATTKALSTNKTAYTDPGSNPGVQGNTASMEARIQLDFYGVAAPDVTQIVSRLIRTDYACQQFAASGVDMQPLYSEEPRNTTMLNAESQYQERWTMDLIAQFNPIVEVPMDFAAQLAINLVDVDVKYPPLG